MPWHVPWGLSPKYCAAHQLLLQTVVKTVVHAAMAFQGCFLQQRGITQWQATQQ